MNEDELPVTVNVGGTEREAVVHQRRVDGDASLGVVEQLVQVEQMPLAATHAVPGTVLV